jgi:hypothetical protein
MDLNAAWISCFLFNRYVDIYYEEAGLKLTEERIR